MCYGRAVTEMCHNLNKDFCSVISVSHRAIYFYNEFLAAPISNTGDDISRVPALAALGNGRRIYNEVLSPWCMHKKAFQAKWMVNLFLFAFPMHKRFICFLFSIYCKLGRKDMALAYFGYYTNDSWVWMTFKLLLAYFEPMSSWHFLNLMCSCTSIMIRWKC